MDYMKWLGILGLMVMSRHWREDRGSGVIFMQSHNFFFYRYAMRAMGVFKVDDDSSDSEWVVVPNPPR